MRPGVVSPPRTVARTSVHSLGLAQAVEVRRPMTGKSGGPQSTDLTRTSLPNMSRLYCSCMY
jgi:hypothetical protein